MPLLNHFQPPARVRAPWESLLTVWVTHLCGWFNRGRREDDYIAHADIWHDERTEDADGPTPVVVETASNPAPVYSFEIRRESRYSLRIKDVRDEMQTVGMIEFVLPKHKSSEAERSQLNRRLAVYFNLGIGFVVVDIVTNRLANLHNELVAALKVRKAARLPDDAATYVAGYRPTRADDRWTIDMWPYVAPVGVNVPTVPLALKNGPLVPLDLEGTYAAALADHNL